MCGIAGFISKSELMKTSQNLVKIMTDKIEHRGPDAEGQWSDSKVALGHRRLSIIDLDESSNQPMFSQDGNYVITYNGEIYNYLEIKGELEQAGVKFKTGSDTEVIIEAYKKYGVEALKKFNGMWAFALYDIINKKVIFSRDRFGIKPLYTINNDKVFAFASEIKAITAAFPEAIIVNVNSVYGYLSGTKNEDTDEQTFYKDVQVFPPSTYMIYDLSTHKTIYGKYWEVNEEEFKRKWIYSKSSPLHTFKDLFEDAVRLRLRADVPVGACLSGGLDSSAIVGCICKNTGNKIHTFSSIYTDKECNEEYYIRKVNEMWNTIPHFIKPDDNESKILECIEDITYHHDQPSGGASIYSQYMVMKGVKGNVKVVLDGQGADELFAGYIPYYSYYFLDLIRQNTLLAKLKAIKTLTVIKKHRPEIIGAISTDVVVNLVGINNSFYFQKKQTDNRLTVQRTVKPFTEEFLKKINDSNKICEINCSSRLNTRLCNDVITRSIPSLLHNEDGNSMAFSIESRVPFLDYRIVEFAIALDGKYKIKNQWTKWIIRKACSEYLPKEVSRRKDKMGFPAAFARWLRTGSSKEELKNIIYAFGERNIVPKESIDAIYRAHIEEKGDFEQILFRYLSMEIWLRRCEKERGEGLIYG